MSNKRIAAVWLAIAACVVAVIFAEQIKFQYVIWRIESADDAAEERAAFILATQAGKIWEISEIPATEFKYLPKKVQPGTNASVLKIEWLEGPWRKYSKPYRAYRVLADPNNRDILRQ